MRQFGPISTVRMEHAAAFSLAAFKDHMETGNSSILLLTYKSVLQPAGTNIESTVYRHTEGSKVNGGRGALPPLTGSLLAPPLIQALYYPLTFLPSMFLFRAAQEVVRKIKSRTFLVGRSFQNRATSLEAAGSCCIEVNPHEK